MKRSTTFVLLVQLSLQSFDEGQAVNPSCLCVRFTSTYGKERGTFSSPDYPRPYSTQASCIIYTFVASSHQIAELLFTDFDVYKENLDCTRGDFIKVYSEFGIQGPGPPTINEYTALSRILCGSRMDAPSALYSYGPMIVLEFHMSGKVSNSTGFIGTFKFIDRRNFETDGVHIKDTWCDYVFDSHQSRPSYGRLYSPRYPSSYPSNIRCNYHFNARKDEKIKIIFEETSLQKGDESCLNRDDIITVYDGRSPTDPVISIICNEAVGYEILSTASELLLQFTANSNVPGQGFKARYQFQAEDNANSGDQHFDVKLKTSIEDSIPVFGPAVSAATYTCHQIFRSDKSKNGTFLSPNYPKPYPQNSQCHYDFTGRGRERVRLSFQDLSLQTIAGPVMDCDNMDSLDIFLYVDGRLEKMVSFCGNELPKPIMSNGPKLSVVFRGVYSARSVRGFKISYSFLEDYAVSSGKQLLKFPCAFAFNSNVSIGGTVTSPNYPGTYPRDTECNYFFYGNQYERIGLRFIHFDIEGVSPCKLISASDYVQFSSEMVDLNSPRYCGQIKDLYVTSDKNFLRITFKSNDRLDANGFKADYIFLKNAVMNSIKMPQDANSGPTEYAVLIHLKFVITMMLIYIVI